MFCTKCGAQLPDGVKFCTSCGAPVDDGDAGRNAASGQTAFAQQSAAGNQVRQVSAPMPQSFSNRTIAIIVAAAVVIIAVALGVMFAKGIGPFASQQASSSTESQTSTSVSASSQSQELTAKSGFSDYSWDEIVSIAKKIEGASSADAATAVAKQYNLVDSSGKLTGATKDITLTDKTTLAVQIVGIYQDDKADGTGKAGLTFITKNSYANHAMNSTATNSGGWSGSAMRSWLNSTVAALLPSPISSNLVTVKKLTNNVGATKSSSSVTATSDKLFLFTHRELLGQISWNSGTSTQYIDTVLNAEGTQYKLFKDTGVAGSATVDPKGMLLKYQGNNGTQLANWWVRSPTPNQSDGFGDVNNGAPDDGGNAAASEGTVFGFCL